jgi:S1-C subfamily serine protease
VPEGVYGPNTRRAIEAWQEARGRETTGLLGNDDAAVLQREGAEPPVQQATIPPEPRSTPSPPSSAPTEKFSLGTAFAINGAGDFLTNHHVVRGCDVVHSRMAGGREPDGRIVASDERNDLAVVHIAGADIPPVHFREGKGIRPADGVVALGFPYAGLLASSPQVTVGAVSALAGLEDDSRYLQLTAPVQPGNSGGPLFDLSGNVVGVVSGRINDLAVAKATGSLPQNINFAIKSGIVREFLDANRVAYLTAASNTKLDPADVGEAATKSTVLIGCSK